MMTSSSSSSSLTLSPETGFVVRESQYRRNAIGCSPRRSIDGRYPIFDKLSRGCSTLHSSKKKKDEVIFSILLVKQANLPGLRLNGCRYLQSLSALNGWLPTIFVALIVQCRECDFVSFYVFEIHACSSARGKLTDVVYARSQRLKFSCVVRSSTRVRYLCCHFINRTTSRRPLFPVI